MKQKHWMSALIAGTIIMVVFSASFGQESSPPPPTAAKAPAEAAKTKQWNTLWGMWVVGGPVMWPIGACSVLAVGLAIYEFLMIRTDKMLRPDLIPPLQDALDKLDMEAAMSICNASPCLLTNLLSAGLKRISDGVLDVSSMEKAMEEASVEETNEGLKPLNNLSVTAQIAPMLGLLGTVTGMIGAFNKIGLGMMGDPEKLAADIGEAMITTAFGLMVAIPAMFAYFYLKAKYIGNVTRLSRVIGNLLHRLVAASRRAQSEGIQPEPAAATAGGEANEN